MDRKTIENRLFYIVWALAAMALWVGYGLVMAGSRRTFVRLVGRMRDERDECCDPLLACQMGLGPGSAVWWWGCGGFCLQLQLDIHSLRMFTLRVSVGVSRGAFGNSSRGIHSLPALIPRSHTCMIKTSR